MKKMKRTVSVLVTATLLATMLSGCGWVGVTSERLEESVISEEELIGDEVVFGEESVIGTESVTGEGTGSGELVSHGSSTYAAEEIDGIEINGDALAIFVGRSTGDQAELELLLDRNIDGQKVTFTSKVKSGTLQVTVKETSRTIGKDQSGERRLMIALPDKTYDKLNVANAFGRIEVQDVAAEQIKAKIEAGQIVMNQVRGKLDVEAEAGEISLNGILLENDLSAKSNVGLVSVSLAESPAAAEVNMSSDIGTVTSELEDVDIQEESGNKLKGKIGAGGPKLTLKSFVGSVELKVAS